ARHRGASAAGHDPAGAVVAGLAWGVLPGRSAAAVAVVSTPFCHRAWVPFPQTGLGLDGAPAAAAPTGRSVELAAGPGAVAVVAGRGAGGGRPLAVGGPGAGRPAQPRSGAAGDGGGFGRVGRPRPAPQTPRKRARTRPHRVPGTPPPPAGADPG